MPKRTKKIAVRVAQVLAATYVLYLFVANVALSTGLAKAIINRSPDRIFIDWSSAYSLWPGSVHATDFVFRGQDSVLQWRFQFDEAWTHFALTELPGKHVHLTSGWARGVSVRIRMKVEPASAGLPASSWLPPIAGYADPPIKGASVPDPPDSDYPYVTIDVDDGAGEDVREVWINGIRSRDHGRVAGGFHFKPMRRVAVHPCTAWLDDATVTEGPEILAVGLRGRAELAIDGFDPRTIDVEKLLESAHARAAMRGAFPSLRGANTHLPPIVALDGGAGHFAFSAKVENGTLEPGAAGIVRSTAWHAFSGVHHLSGTTELRGKVDARWDLVAETTDATLSRVTTVTARMPALTAIVHTTPRIAFAAREAIASVDVPAASMPDVHVLDAYIGDAIFERGSADVSVHADLEKKILRGRVRGTITDATLLVRNRPFITDATIDLALARFRTDTGHGDLTGSTVELRNRSTGWWARTTVGPGTVDPDGIDLVLTAKARDAKPLWTVLAVPRVVQDIIGGRSLTITGQFHAGADGLSLERTHAVGDDFDALATYSSKPKGGAALLLRGPFSAGVEIRGDDVSVTPFATQAWYRGALARRQDERVEERKDIRNER